MCVCVEIVPPSLPLYVLEQVFLPIIKLSAYYLSIKKGGRREGEGNGKQNDCDGLFATPPTKNVDVIFFTHTTVGFLGSCLLIWAFF